MGILVVSKVSCSVFEIEILLKIIKGLYEISLVACYTNYIFWELIPCYRAFCIKEIKLALLRLYVVNQAFLTSNIL